MARIPNLYDVLSELNYIRPSKNNSVVSSNLDSVDSSINVNSVYNNNNALDIIPITSLINPYPYTLREFSDFLVRTHCEENLEFFIMTRRFLLYDDKKSIKSSTTSTISSKISNFDIDLWNNSIYDQFIKVDSPKECNLPQYIRELFDNCHKEGVAPRQVFIVQAIQHILGLLLDAYSRFLQYTKQLLSSNDDRDEKINKDIVLTRQISSKSNTPITPVNNNNNSCKVDEENLFLSNTTSNNNTNINTFNNSNVSKNFEDIYLPPIITKRSSLPSIKSESPSLSSSTPSANTSSSSSSSSSSFTSASVSRRNTTPIKGINKSSSKLKSKNQHSNKHNHHKTVVRNNNNNTKNSIITNKKTASKSKNESTLHTSSKHSIHHSSPSSTAHIHPSAMSRSDSPHSILLKSRKFFDKLKFKKTVPI